MTEHILVEDGQENVLTAIEQMKRRPVDMILCTGGMSVDPDAPRWPSETPARTS